MDAKEIFEAMEAMQKLSRAGITLTFDAEGRGVAVKLNDGLSIWYSSFWRAAKAIETTVEW